MEKLSHKSSVPLSENKRYYSVGIELVASFITSMLIAWGIGSLFTFSHFWRVILGGGLGIASNLLVLYKLVKK